MEGEILNKIKNSEGLRNLAQLIEELNEAFDDSIKEMVDEEKKALDEKVDRSKFSFIVIKSQFYRTLIDAMKNFNAQLGTDLDRGRQQYTELIQFAPDEDTIFDLLA